MSEKVSILTLRLTAEEAAQMEVEHPADVSRKGDS